MNASLFLKSHTRRNILKKQAHEDLISDCHELAKMINGLIKSLKD